MIKPIEFKNSRGEKITGILKKKNRPSLLLICGHGLNSSKEHPATDGITQMLYEMGYSSFSFDFSKSAKGFSLKEQVRDVVDIINYFSNYKNIILLAPSLGALSMVIASLQSKKPKGLITINGFFGTAQLGRSIIKEYLLFRLFVFFNKQYRQNWNYFKQQYKPEKITYSVLVIHAKPDEVVFISQSKKFFQQLSGKKEFFILQNADHELTKKPYMQETANVIDQWLRRHFGTKSYPALWHIS